MWHRLTWLTTAPLMLAGLLAGHFLGYRLAFSDGHARSDALAHSGHAYMGYAPLALTACLGVLLAGLALQAVSAFRGEPRRPLGSPAIVLLSPLAFVAQELVERVVYSGHLSATALVEPSFLFGLALQLPFALAALLLAWVLDSAARTVGGALAAGQPSLFPIFVPAPFCVAAAPRPAGLARGYGERAPPVTQRP
jgi:hypothetical protein